MPSSRTLTVNELLEFRLERVVRADDDGVDLMTSSGDILELRFPSVPDNDIHSPDPNMLEIYLVEAQ